MPWPARTAGGAARRRGAGRVFPSPWRVNALTRGALPGRPARPWRAARLSAIHGYIALYFGALMTEFPLHRCGGADARAAAAVIHAPTWRRALGLGFTLALATLLRQSILPWVAAMFVLVAGAGWVRRQLPATLVGLGLAGLVLALAIAPFTIRNYRVYGEFLLLNSNAGYAMYSAQHPMHGATFSEFAAAPIPEEMWGQTEAQMDRDLMRLGIGFVLADPLRYLALSASRLLDTSSSASPTRRP